MTNEQLRYYLALIKHGNINTAAEALLVDRKAFTRSLQALEDELQAQLYDRQRGRAKRVVITKIGQLVEDYAQTVLNLTDKLKEDITELNSGRLPIVNIAVSPALNLPLHKHYLLPFAKKHPEFRWSTTEFSVPEMEHAVLTEAIEIGFSNSHLLHPGDFKILSSVPTQYHIVCRKDTHWLDIHQAYKLQDLAAVPLFLTLSSGKMLLSAFQRLGIKPHVLATNRMRNVSIFNTLSDLGITIYPSAYPPADPELTWVPLDEPSLSSQDILFKKPEHILSPIAQTLVDYYQEHRQL